ncbi:hypothetical protein VTN49DRAFT_1849 [Thermomyces lanuginosus]|uniref:uncharacterized protein n=1 Tax=Thermomyces lanuginosus TaxID=5541 RepID=UPI003742B0B1
MGRSFSLFSCLIFLCPCLSFCFFKYCVLCLFSSFLLDVSVSGDEEWKWLGHVRSRVARGGRLAAGQFGLLPDLIVLGP